LDRQTITEFNPRNFILLFPGLIKSPLEVVVKAKKVDWISSHSTYLLQHPPLEEGTQP